MNIKSVWPTLILPKDHRASSALGPSPAGCPCQAAPGHCRPSAPRGRARAEAPQGPRVPAQGGDPVPGAAPPPLLLRARGSPAPRGARLAAAGSTASPGEGAAPSRPGRGSCLTLSPGHGQEHRHHPCWDCSALLIFRPSVPSGPADPRVLPGPRQRHRSVSRRWHNKPRVGIIGYHIVRIMRWCGIGSI